MNAIKYSMKAICLTLRAFQRFFASWSNWKALGISFDRANTLQVDFDNLRQ